MGNASKWRSKLVEHFPQPAVMVKRKADSLLAVVSTGSTNVYKLTQTGTT